MIPEHTFDKQRMGRKKDLRPDWSGTTVQSVKRYYDRCVRCGAGVPWGRSVCRDCNPAGLPAPSPSQYHATVFLAVLAVVALMTLFFLLRA
jgi:ribosomal protein L40E